MIPSIARRRRGTLEVRVYRGPGLAEILPDVDAFEGEGLTGHLSRRPAMLGVLQRGLRHSPYLLVARRHGRIVGYLALAHVKSLLFGAFLVSLPYVNSGGVVAEDDDAAGKLVDEAVRLADELKVRYLELRHERPIEHPALGPPASSKVHMRLGLPEKVDELWEGLDPKVRNQVRKGQKNGLSVDWGGEDLLPDFYRIFSENMRDLGTPVYGRRLFASLLRECGGRAEICVARGEGRALAAALLLHGRGVTEVPSASSLRRHNASNANMFMYWHLLDRAVQRGQGTFDFGRSTVGGGTYKFKRQWGAVEAPAAWQYHLRGGSRKPMRPENEGFRLLSRAWRHMPLWASNAVGPMIVRGIP